MKTFLKRILSAGTKAYSIPTLPDNIIKIQSYPIIRILRFLGGLSLLMILSKSYLKYPSIFLYVFFVFAIIFSIYHFIICFFRLKHMVSEFNSNKFEIRNSPLDRFATLGAKVLWCLKGACESAQPLGVALGVMVSTDTILKDSNREPIFAPFLVDMVNRILPATNDQQISRTVENHLSQMKLNNTELADTSKAIETVKKFQGEGELSAEDSAEFVQLLTSHKNEVVQNNVQIKKNLIELILKKNK